MRTALVFDLYNAVQVFLFLFVFLSVNVEELVRLWYGFRRGFFFLPSLTNVEVEGSCLLCAARVR